MQLTRRRGRKTTAPISSSPRPGASLQVVQKLILFSILTSSDHLVIVFVGPAVVVVAADVELVDEVALGVRARLRVQLRVSGVGVLQLE